MIQKTRMASIILGATLVILPGCQREKELPVSEPDALSARIEGGATRTSFDSLEGKFAWTTGDKIAIHYSNGSYQTYQVNPSDGSVLASVPSASTHRDYYAIYPASAADADNYGNTTLKVTLPDTYDIKDLVSVMFSTTATAEEKKAATEYSPVPMVAVNSENSTLLDFYHVGGLLRITVSGLNENTNKLKVTFDKDVTGSYAVTYATDEQNRRVPSISTRGTSSNKDVTFLLSDTSVGSDPDPEHPRIIVLNVPVPCGTYQSVTVSTYSNDTFQSSRTYDTKPLVFARHRGKKLEFGELKFTFFFGTYADGGTINPINDVEKSYAGGTGSLSSSFVSYKTDGVTMEPVPFWMEYYDDEAGEWYRFVNPDTGMMNPQVPEWFTFGSAIDYQGSIPGEGNVQNLGVVLSAQSNSDPDPHHDVLTDANHAAKGSPESPFDLSTINVATGETVATSTANCYVVQAAGYYKFPLVYGNGLRNGNVNRPAFHRTSSAVSQYFMNDLVDHMDNAIKRVEDGGNGPYIAAQHQGKTFSAGLVWTDIPGLVTNVTYHAGDETDLTDDYISFTVPKDNITQGNALIAIYAQSGNEKKIAWSWHIWVTEEDMTSVRPGPGGSYSFAPVNLGTQETYTKTYLGRSSAVRAVQEVSGKTSSATISEQGGTMLSFYNYLLYQWGRKDPITAYNKQKSSAKDRYNASGTLISGVPNIIRTYTTDDAPTVGFSIQNPRAYIRYQRNDWVNNSWLDGTQIGFVNFWNSAQNTTNNTATSSSTKTIYDPSPVGYKVPPLLDRSLFTTTTFPYISSTSLGGQKPDGRYYDVDGDGAFNESVDAYFPALHRYDGAFLQTTIWAVGDSYLGGYWTALGYMSYYGESGEPFRFTQTGFETQVNAIEYMRIAYAVRPIVDVW